MKILSIHDLQIIRKRAEHHLSLREESNEKVSEKCCGLASGTAHLQILICGGTGCKASSSQGITENLQKAIERNGITDKVDVITVGCFGFCEKGPIVKIIPDNTFYTQVTPEDAEEIISEHIIGGRRIERLLYIDPKTEQTVSDSKHMDFYRKQLRIALRNCGFIDSENIEEYIAREGYFALADCLLNKQPADVIDVIKRSGLRGRGGGGFPTGLKWEFASKQVSDVKYVVCNADEGDPGAFMDRSIMEGNPHSIIEGMLIAALGAGSDEGYIYVRAEYPLAVARLKTAIKKAEEMNLLGERIRYGLITLFLLSPLAVLYIYLWLHILKTAPKKEKWIYTLLLLSHLCFVPAFVLTIDWGRWFGAFLTMQALQIVILAAKKDVPVLSALHTLEGAFRKHPYLFIAAGIWLGSLHKFQATLLPDAPVFFTSLYKLYRLFIF